VEAEGHIFIGPDNGLFGLILRSHPDAVPILLQDSRYFLEPVSSTFHGRDVFAPAAAHVAKGIPLSRMGPPLSDPVPLDLPRPLKTNDRLEGLLIRSDRFGNLITNITKQDLESFLMGNSPRISLAGAVLVEGLSKTYEDVPEGRFLALLGSSNVLEIAVNRGSAADKIGGRSVWKTSRVVVTPGGGGDVSDLL
jgi:S-adenosylmethionine hydrolase